jgi:predicted SprT family Zn-dependent metalloprotease
MYTTENHIDLYLKPTQETYDGFQRAYEHYNFGLFDGRLPNCLITLQRKGRTMGYFCRQRFVRDDGSYCDEIAMNPVYFNDRDTEEVLQTLVHEMVHLWQFHFGNAGRGRYHNRQWADKMKQVGLHPSHTGKVGGRELGDQMMDYIIDGGAFERETKILLAQGFKITWRDHKLGKGAFSPSPIDPNAASNGSDTKAGKRVKYSCAQCGLNAWAKHDASLICGKDRIIMTSQ